MTAPWRTRGSGPRGGASPRRWPFATAHAVPWAAAADIPGTAHAGSRLNAVQGLQAHGPAQSNRASSGFRPDTLDPASARLTRPGSRPDCTRFGLAAARGPGSTRMRPAVRVTRPEPVLAGPHMGLLAVSRVAVMVANLKWALDTRGGDLTPSHAAQRDPPKLAKIFSICHKTYV